jgi:hypothetical protein
MRARVRYTLRISSSYHDREKSPRTRASGLMRPVSSLLILVTERGPSGVERKMLDFAFAGMME